MTNYKYIVPPALGKYKISRVQVLPKSIQENWRGLLILSIIIIPVASIGLLGSSLPSSLFPAYGTLAEQAHSMHHAQNTINKESMGEVQLGDFSINRTITGLDNAKKSEIIDTVPNGTTLQLEAKPVAKSINGTVIRMYGYNGQIPGPMIKVRQGSSIFVNFTNNLDVETAVHWHGLRVENRNDGVPGITQAPVQPGESFLYKLNFPDEGIYWYHSHSREDMQVELGLYGNILVQPKSEDHYYNPVNREVALFLDDIRISDNGDVDTFNKDHDRFSLMGRFGNIMLLNGETDYQFNVREGEVVRFLLTDSANTRMFNFSIDDHKMKLVGGDGGKYEKESFVDSVIFSPAERYIVEVLFDRAGTFKLLHTIPGKTYTLGVVNVIPETAELGGKGQDFSSSYYNILKTNEDLSAQHALLFKKYLFAKPDYQLTLTVEMEGMNHEDMNHEVGGATNNVMMKDMDMTMMKDMDTDTEEKKLISHAIEPVEWNEEEGSADAKMNSLSTDMNTRWILKDTATGKENKDINYQMKVGEFKKISLFNDPNSPHPMQHPIHIHGLHFLVLSQDGKPNNNLVWKDVVLVPRGSTVDILLAADNPGKWAMHCHILEHAMHMLTVLTVED